MEIDFNGTVRDVCKQLPNEVLGEVIAEIVAAGFDMRRELRTMPPDFLALYFADVFNNFFNVSAIDAMREEQQKHLIERLEEYENGTRN